MSEHLPEPNFSAFRYNGPTYTGQTELCRANLFLPDGEAPDGGWPCVLAPATAGWVTTWDVSSIGANSHDFTNRAWHRAFIDNGIAVVTFTVTVPRSKLSIPVLEDLFSVAHSCGRSSDVDPNSVGYTMSQAQIDDDNNCSIDNIMLENGNPGPSVELNTNLYGPAYPGNGVIHHYDWDYTAPGLSATFAVHPYSDVTKPSSLKDCVAMLQYCIDNSDAMQINPWKFIAYGQSAASYILWNVAGGEELNTITWPNGTGQETHTTKGRFIARVFGNSPTYVPGNSQGDIGQFFLATSGVNSFPNDPLGDAGFGTDFQDYDYLGKFLGDGEGSPTVALQGIPPSIQEANSPLVWVTKTSEIQEYNQNIPTYLFNTDSAQLPEISTNGSPYDKTNTTANGNWHSSWYAACMARALNRGKFRFVVEKEATKLSITDDLPTFDDEQYITPIQLDKELQPQDMVAWLFATANISRSESVQGSFGNAPSPSITKTITSKQNLEKGISYPIASSLKSIVGTVSNFDNTYRSEEYFTISFGEALIKSQLRQYLLCQKGERVMLPKFGLNLHKYLFEQMDETLFELIKEEIATGITVNFPNLRILSLKVSQDDTSNSIYIALRLQFLDGSKTIFDMNVNIR